MVGQLAEVSEDPVAVLVLTHVVLNTANRGGGRGAGG